MSRSDLRCEGLSCPECGAVPVLATVGYFCPSCHASFDSRQELAVADS